MFAQPIGCCRVTPKERFEGHVLSSNIKMDGVEVIIVIDWLLVAPATESE